MSCKDYTKVLRIASGQEAETDFILVEHAYSKPFNWNPGLSTGRPRKTLFLSRIVKDPKNVNNNDDEIDVVTVNPVCDPVPYDIDKAKHVMNECERHVRGISQSEDDLSSDDEAESEVWEEKVNRTNWSPVQNDTFESVVKILDSHHLARLALSGTPNEPVRRRAVVDKAAAKFRRLFAKMNWDNKLTQWLHGCLLQNLTPSYLAAYIDVLQTLKSKIPTLVDKMIALAVLPKTPRVEALNLLLKRPWDPALPSLNQSKPKKLEKMPIIIIVPNGAFSHNLPQASRRTRFFNTQLQHLAKSIPVTVSATPEMSDAKSILDGILLEVRSKIAECNRQYSGQPIVLLGWGLGAILAAMISLTEKVDALILLGFPMQSHIGKRGETDDILLDMSTPSLFIIGSKALNTSIDDVEDFRHRLKAITSLVVISDAEATLKISNKKQYWEGLTQSMVDRCIVDEIGDFLSSVLCDEAQIPLPAVQTQSVSNSPVESGAVVVPKTKVGREPSKKRKASPQLYDASYQIPSKVFRTGTNLSQQLGLKIPSASSVQQPSDASSSSMLNTQMEVQMQNEPTSSKKDVPTTSDAGASFLGNLLTIPPSKNRSAQSVSKPNSSVTTISIGGLASVSKQRYQSLFQATEKAYEDTRGREDCARSPQTVASPVVPNKRGRPSNKMKGVGRGAPTDSSPVKNFGRGRPRADKSKNSQLPIDEDASMAVLTFTGGATDNEGQDRIEGLSTVGRGFLTLARGGGTSSVRVFSTNSGKMISQKNNSSGESSVIKLSSGTAIPSIAGVSSIKTEPASTVSDSNKSSIISNIVFSEKGIECNENSKIQPKSIASLGSLMQTSVEQLPVGLQGISTTLLESEPKGIMSPKTITTGKSTVMIVTSSSSTKPLISSSFITKAPVKSAPDMETDPLAITPNQANAEAVNLSSIVQISPSDSWSPTTSKKLPDDKINETILQSDQGSPLQLSQIKSNQLGIKGDSLFVVTPKSVNTAIKSDFRPIVVSTKTAACSNPLSPSSPKISITKVLKTPSVKLASQTVPTSHIQLCTKSLGTDRIIFTAPIKKNVSEVIPIISTIGSSNPVITDVKPVQQPISQSAIVTKKIVISKKIYKEFMDNMSEKQASTPPLTSSMEPKLVSLPKLSPAEELNLVLGQTADALSSTIDTKQDGWKSGKSVQVNTAQRRLSEIKVSITTPTKSKISNRENPPNITLTPITETTVETPSPESIQKPLAKEDSVSRITRSTAKVSPVGSTRRGRNFRPSI